MLMMSDEQLRDLGLELESLRHDCRECVERTLGCQLGWVGVVECVCEALKKEQ